MDYIKVILIALVSFAIGHMGNAALYVANESFAFYTLNGNAFWGVEQANIAISVITAASFTTYMFTKVKILNEDIDL